MDIKVSDLQAVKQVENQTQVAPKDDSFKFTLISKVSEQELQERLNTLMSDIVTSGERIKKHMNIRDMKNYRALIKTFLNEKKILLLLLHHLIHQYYVSVLTHNLKVHDTSVVALTIL